MEETIELEKRGFLRRVGIGLLNLFTPGLGLVRLGQYQLGFAVMAVSLAIVPVTFFLCSRLPSQTFRPCGQCGFPNQLVSDSTLFFGESSGGSRFDVGRGVGVL